MGAGCPVGARGVRAGELLPADSVIIHGLFAYFRVLRTDGVTFAPLPPPLGLSLVTQPFNHRFRRGRGRRQARAAVVARRASVTSSKAGLPHACPICGLVRSVLRALRIDTR